MTPEERKAIAMCQPEAPMAVICGGDYPACCSYHQGFDDALALVTDMVYEGGGFYTIEPPEATP